MAIISEEKLAEYTRTKLILGEMIDTAQITDADNHGDFSFYEVYLNSDLWDELKKVVG
jgi:hypothetical protein